ncbi:MAG: hypothetical protein KGS72_15540 [Cyanobacteria bacterium REEB67]|nr:hypothetical protein [Cyanobacteria bacterium REEB67]
MNLLRNNLIAFTAATLSLGCAILPVAAKHKAESKPAPLSSGVSAEAKAEGGRETKAADIIGTPSNPPVAGDSAVSADSKDMAITIYNQNFGLVKDVRDIMLHEGHNDIRFDDVAAGIDPTSVSFISLTAPNSVAVREQNYQFDLMDLNSILTRSVGKNVRFRQFLPAGGERLVEGILLSPPQATVADSNGNLSQQAQAVVVRTASGIIVAPTGQLELAELPSGLISKPCLLWKIDSDKSGVQKSEISYQTQGLNWKCDYVAVDNADDTQIDMTSWVTLDNKSGATYKNASLKLVAGDVHKVQENVVNPQGMDAFALPMPSTAPQFSEQSFAEYHLYALAGKTNLADNETKQMTLFNANAVPVKKRFVFEPSGPTEEGQQPDESSKIKVKLEFANSKENNLGMALPKGKVRVYKKDNDGALQFVGEDLIDHTPRDEKVRLMVGNAFDVVGGLKQMNFSQTTKLQKQTCEVSLRNHKDSDVNVTFIGHANGDWKITDSSVPFTKKDSTTFEVTLSVLKNSETRASYTLETRL